MKRQLLIAILVACLTGVSSAQAAPANHAQSAKNEQQTKSLDTDTKQWSQQFDNVVENFGKLLAGWTAVFVEKAHADIDSGLSSLENWLNAQHQPKK
jgi:hypothetical protein